MKNRESEKAERERERGVCGFVVVMCNRRNTNRDVEFSSQYTYI